MAVPRPDDDAWLERDEHGALLIVDDVRAGFRLARDCSWEPMGVRPDLSCWGKAIANWSMSSSPRPSMPSDRTIRQASMILRTAGVGSFSKSM